MCEVQIEKNGGCNHVCVSLVLLFVILVLKQLQMHCVQCR